MIFRVRIGPRGRTYAVAFDASSTRSPNDQHTIGVVNVNAFGGFALARFGYRVFDTGQLASALDMPFIADPDAAHVHAPVEEFYRVDRMRKRGYVNGERWRVSFYPVEYSLRSPLPVRFGYSSSSAPP